MSESEIKVNIKVDKTGQGDREVEDGLKNVGKASQEASTKTRSALDGMGRGIGALRKVLTGFGVAGLFTGLISGITKIASSFGAAQREAEAFKAIQYELASSKAIQALANDYSHLTEQIAQSAEEARHMSEMAELEARNSRRLARARMESAKEAELAALDANDPGYSAKKAEIESRYAAGWAVESRRHEREDIERQSNGLRSQADAKEAEAAAMDKRIEELEARLEAEISRRSKASQASVAYNEEDKNGFFDTFGKSVGQILTLEWGRAWKRDTSAGDAIRREAAKEAADSELRIQGLEEEIAKAKARQGGLRTEAGHLREKAGAHEGAIEAADIEAATAVSAAGRQERGDRTAVRMQEDEYSDAVAAEEGLRREKEALTRRIEEEKSRKAAAGKAVYDAEGAVRLAAAGGGAGERRSAAVRLSAAEAAARDVDFEADRTIQALTEALRSVEMRLKAAQSRIERQSGQTRYAWSEAPAGE